MYVFTVPDVAVGYCKMFFRVLTSLSHKEFTHFDCINQLKPQCNMINVCVRFLKSQTVNIIYCLKEIIS